MGFGFGMVDREKNTLKSFLVRRTEQEFPQHRQRCARCWKSLVTCFCSQLKPFAAPFSFVIVQHLDEARNPIATARMAHLSIINSRLILDNDFSQNPEVDKLLSDSNRFHLMLYPSPDAVELDDVINGKFNSGDNQVFEDDKEIKPIVFWVLDTTWSYTNKMLRLSPSLKSIPMVKFDPDISSKFLIRRQPNEKCLSTIESIYLVIERWRKLYQETYTDHGALLQVFQYMVNQQLDFGRHPNNKRQCASKAARMAFKKVINTP